MNINGYYYNIYMYVYIYDTFVHEKRVFSHNLNFMNHIDTHYM